MGFSPSGSEAVRPTAASRRRARSSARQPSTMLRLIVLFAIFLIGYTDAAPPNAQNGYASGRVPILYEAYYPEPREWSPQMSLREIERLRELTSQLLHEEEQLGKLAAAAADATPENVYEPRGQVLEYVFSRPADDDVQVTSLTVSDSGPQAQQPQHRVRHHHGEADWLRRRRLASAAVR